MTEKIKMPILLVLAVIMVLCMLRLSIWQLDRAEQKQVILDQVTSRSKGAVVALNSILTKINITDDRYRNINVQGQYLHDQSIYVDNQVVEGQVGYLVFTPLKILGTDQVIMVNRGWMSVGASRQQLPIFTSIVGTQFLQGRLNIPPAQPPLWSDDYSVDQGKVWAYLPLEKYALQMQLKLLPLVLELAPEKNGESDPQFKIVRPEINDQWVAKHKGYAFQWLVMAIAFFIACCILLLRTMRKKRSSKPLN